jgi:hypothetical protein
MHFASSTARRRAAFLGSTALLALLASPAAAAGERGVVTGPGASLSVVGPERISSQLPFGEAQPQSATRADLDYAPPEPQAALGVVPPEQQIVISNPGNSTTSRDPTNVTGIGQMVVDQQNGFIGLCTGTLINPRTVLFAAHCVNAKAATAYGAATGGTPISFGFQTDNLPGLQRWFNATIGGQPNTLRYQSNPALFLYNVNQVRYNPLSLEPAAQGFLYGDVATATLDTPASNVPTWAMLFSQLPATTITANGTGYNVQIAGYGSNGSATTGSASGSDFRRRIAENMIGALTDLFQFETFLFGSSTSPTQNLYFMDFDDPRRGLTGASPFDFNAFRDNARGTNEGITGPGDSGGPLILQNTFNRLVTIGVLSGGYPRFFNGQPNNGYGSVSFYQPLFLYWDWIAANNPYRYATNIAGDRNWTDAANWITTNDPNYFIIGANGQLVNGVPTDLGLQKGGTGGDFGEICFQTSTTSECRNTATGAERIENKPIGTTDEEVAELVATSVRGWMDGVAPEAQDGSATTQALPPATIANGLPGAINFVPNNSDPARSTGAIGRYFDVTLAANGTTTLNTAVTIDRFSIAGAGARLNIATGGTLTSLIDVTQAAGVMQVDGTLTSRGDYLFMGGGLLGSGRINAPFTTNVAGSIGPGNVGTIGTLTFGGNLVLASASALVIDTGAGGFSDRVDVVATSFSTAGAALDGRATLGGRVAIASATGTRIRYNDIYTILTAQGGITGTFQSMTPVSAILLPEFIYTANSVQIRINAARYIDVVGTSPVQRAYATLLDANRNSGTLLGIFDTLDLQSQATIQATLDSLAPRTESMRTALGIAALDDSSRFIRQRLTSLQPGNLGGALAYYGRPIQTAALAMSSMGNDNMAQSDANTQPQIAPGSLPETMSGFVAAGYLDGDSLPMATALPLGGRDQFNGWYVGGGLETEIGEGGAAGFALSYTELDGDSAVGGQSAVGRLYQGTLYGKHSFNQRYYVDGLFSIGILETTTARPGSLPGQSVTLRSDDGSMALGGEVGLGAMFGDRIQFGPRVAARVSHVNFTALSESGGATALRIDRPDYDSFQGRGGLVVNGVGRVRPQASVAFVHEFNDRAATFGANFVGGVGSNVLFDLARQDHNWFEVAAGVGVDIGDVELSVSADTTVARDDVRNQSYRASVRIPF